MKTLLLEIGTEEIPAGYIAPALAALESMLAQKLADARIAHGRIQTFGTPRRLSVTVAELAARQKRLTSEVLGPPRKVGYDSDGRPTTAAVKFAEKVGLPVNRLGVASTPKGEYLSATVTDPGLATTALLKTLLPDIILAIPFPKRMRWADLTISFARPIHSLLALYGGSRIDFTLGGIRSGRTSFGHRFMHPRPIKVAEPAAYVEALRSGFVIVDPAERRRLIAEGAAQAAAAVGGHVLPDEELLGTVTQLVEYPAIAVGRFADAFLELPAEVLITAMREHQKYFAVVDAGGRLLPHFIAVNNTPVQDMAVVVRGHERVLRARLEDAKFFFRSDRETSLDTMVEKLKSVLFQAQLGSIYDKVRRVRGLARFVADQLGGDAGARQRRWNGRPGSARPTWSARWWASFPSCRALWGGSMPRPRGNPRPWRAPSKSTTGRPIPAGRCRRPRPGRWSPSPTSWTPSAAASGPGWPPRVRPTPMPSAARASA